MTRKWIEEIFTMITISFFLTAPQFYEENHISIFVSNASK